MSTNWVGAVDLTTRLRRVIGCLQPLVLGCGLPSRFVSTKNNTCFSIIYWQYEGLKYEKLENWPSHILDFEKHLKDAHRKTVQIGCDTFPNQLVRFHSEGKPIWKNIKKLSENVVIC